MNRRVTILLSVSLGLAALAIAQQDASPQFEVAAIKEVDQETRQIGIFGEADRFIAGNVTLKMLIAFAYDLRDFQVLGGPKWADSLRFSVDAKTPVGTPAPQSSEGRGQRRLMLQALLADRFQLVLARESKLETAYQWVVARDGPKLNEPAHPDGSSLRGARGQIRATAAQVSAFTRLLSQQLGRIVTDGTGLTGKYDFDLIYEPEGGQPGSGPSIFTALHEQLGLELRSVKVPADLFVIRQATRPGAN